jgi:hypothetical protein
VAALPVVGGIFKPGNLQAAFGLSAGAIVAGIGTPMLVKQISGFWPGAANPQLRPLFTAITGALASQVARFIPRGGRIANYMLLGGAVAAAMDVLNTYIVPKLGFTGYRDYVQLPYSGYGTPAQVEAGRFQDYVQLPYSGYGTPAQVEAGQFQGMGDHDETGTFAPSF